MAKVEDKTPTEEFKSVKVVLEKPSEVVETVQVVIAPRHSIYVQTAAGRTRIGPGEMVDVPVTDAVQLRRGGFLVENSTTAAKVPEPDLRTQPLVEQIKPTVNGRDGTTVTVDQA